MKIVTTRILASSKVLVVIPGTDTSLRPTYTTYTVALQHALASCLAQAATLVMSQTYVDSAIHTVYDSKASWYLWRGRTIP